MRAIDPALESILRSRFQAAASGFRGRIEVDVPVEASGTPLVVQSAVNESAFNATYNVTLASPPTEGHILVAYWWHWPGGGTSIISPNSISGGTWVKDAEGQGYDATQYGGPGARATLIVYSRLVGAGESNVITVVPGISGTSLMVVEIAGGDWAARSVVTDTVTLNHNGTLTLSDTVSGPGLMIVGWGMQRTTYAPADSVTPSTGATELIDSQPASIGAPHRWVASITRAKAGTISVGGTVAPNAHLNKWGVFGVGLTFEADAPAPFIRSFRVARIGMSRGFSLPADGVTVEIPNEALTLGFGATGIIPTGSRMRTYQWFGDAEHEVLTGTWLVDVVTDSRDLLRTVIAARDLMSLLTDQTFSASAPQGEDEDGADQTPANGVFVGMEVSAIVEHILDEAGWPADAREITPTSYVLDRFVIADGSSWASAIRGEERLTGLVGYFLWTDEDGVIHFAPTPAANILSDPGDPAYSYVVGADGETELTSGHVTSLMTETSGYPLRTRVKVRGPLTTLKDAWTELWRTTKLRYPVGIWYDPTTPEQIRVLDRGTKRLYRIRQSDREILGSANLSAVLPYPLGLSGDPSDATVYWVLNAPWAFGGGTSGNQVKKIRKSDHVVLGTYSIPNGRWSAIKVSASYVYLTNLDTDRFYRRDKTDLSAVADYGHTVDSVTQLNPSGIMVNGTTLYLFWYNSGNTPRFLLCDESAPGTVTGTIATAGVTLVGGEMDTTTGTECWGGSDLQGIVAKFTLVEPDTEDVAVEVIATDLEDELGALAQTEPRTHDAHPGDAAHPFVVRRETLTLPMISSLAQATETAQRRLELLARRDRVVDVGIVGNPALQKADVLYLSDPRTGLAGLYVIDTYRTEMDAASNTYLGTLALIPAGPEATDDPEDDGEGTDPE